MVRNIGAILFVGLSVWVGFIIVNHYQNNITEKTHYLNIDLRIVQFNSDCSFTDDKFHTPQLCNTILFETLTEPHLYAEINTCGIRTYGNKKLIKIDTPWLYNHKIGDTVHFDYLLRTRFFEIKNRKR